MTKKNFYKITSIFLSSLLISTMVIGCGSSSQENNSSKTETQKAVLKVFDCQAYGLDAYDSMAKDFEKSHPGLTIEIQHAANDGNTLLQSRVNSGDIPDVFAVQAGTYAESYYDYAYDWSNDSEILNLFKEDALKMGQDKDGKIKALPWSYQNMGLIYNKDCFEKAGITELPVTIEQLEKDCEKLKATGITPIGLDTMDGWSLAQLATHFMLDKKLGAQGTNDALVEGKLTFNDLPHWDNLFRFLDLALKYGTDKPMEIDWERSENMIANGESAIFHMGDWCQEVLDSFNPNANLAFLPVPVGTSAEDTTVLTRCTWVFIVNKDSKNLDLAKEFLTYTLTSDQGIAWTCDAVKAVSAAKTNVEVKGTLANDAQTYISSGKTDGWIHTIAPLGYGETCGPYIQAYLTGDMTQEEVTKAFQEFFQKK